VNLSGRTHAERPFAAGARREYSGKALKDLATEGFVQDHAQSGEQLAGFAELRNDGSTSSGCWISAARGTDRQSHGRRDNSDPTGIGQTVNWAFAWLPTPGLYNRASCDPSGSHSIRSGARLVERYAGAAPTFQTSRSMRIPPRHGPLYEPEGVARFFARQHAEGPSRAYEPSRATRHESAKSEGAAGSEHPAARVFDDDARRSEVAQFLMRPRPTLTEHFHYWTNTCA